MRGVIIAAVLALGLSGCATAIMEGYIGKPVQQAMIDRGPPDMVMDLPDGRRAFQWVINSSYTTPRQTYGQANIYAPPGAYANVNYNQMTFGGQTITSSCRYTMYASWDEAQRTWVFVGFEKPRLDCM